MLYRAVTSGQSLGDAATVDFVWSGGTLKPYAPTFIHGIRNNLGDLTATWIPRTRIGGGVRSSQTGAVLEERDEFRLEIYDSAGTTLKRVLTTKGDVTVSQPAMLIGRDPSMVSGNNLLNPGAGPLTDSWSAYSQQELREVGAWAEATLHLTASSTDSAMIGFVDSSLAATSSSGISGSLKAFNLQYFKVGGTATFAVSEFGVLGYSAGISGNPDSIRVHGEFNGQDARFYYNITGPGDPPVYISQQPVTMPYRLLLIAGAENQVDDVIFSVGHFAAIYTADQQTADFGSPQSSIRIKIAQVSALVGPGFYADVVL